MKSFRLTHASSTTIASVGALYLVIVTLTVVLAGRVLEVEYTADRTVVLLLLGVAVLFPAALAVAVGAAVVRLFRERRSGRPGSAFKARLSIFFAVIVFLVAVPQGVVSVAFLSSALSMLFQTETGLSLRSGLDIALDYYDSQVQILERFVMPQVHAVASPRDAEAYGRVWNGVRTALPGAHSMQVFDADGVETVRFGSDEDPLAFSAARTLRTDGVTRTGGDSRSLLRLVARPPHGPADTTQLVVVSAALPVGFDQAARRLTRSVELFARAVAALYVGFASPIFLLALLAGFFLSDQIIRPIESLEEATRRVADGDYSVRILTPAGDDLGLLVMSFNRMVLELEHTRRRITQAEKVAAWQDIAQRLAHEVKNPLTPIRLAAERLRRKYAAGAPDFEHVLDRTVDTIVREVDALTTLLNEFRAFARMPVPDIRPARLADVVRDAAATLAAVSGVSVDLSELDTDLVVAVDERQMRQVFVNLFTNAVEAAEGAVTIRVGASLVKRGQSTYCRVRVQDNGPGIPEELRQTLFQPYVTGKPHGTGLGLAIVDRIVFDHDGRVSVESEFGSGATFLIDLPMDVL